MNIRLRIVAAVVLALSCWPAAIGMAHAAPNQKAKPRPKIAGQAPKPPTDLRRRNSLVMDVDFEETASSVNSDELDIVGTIQLILDRIAAQTAPLNDFGQARPIVWVPLTGDKECHDSTDAGILEIRVARFIAQQRNFIFVGHQIEKADLSFRLFDCSGREILHYPLDPSSQYAESSFSPYFLSLTGTVAVVALANAHSNNSSIAAVLTVINDYSVLQANIGYHDPNNLRLLALYRLMGNIPGTAVPPPAPGTVASLLQTCGFTADADNVVRLQCAPQAGP